MADSLAGGATPQRFENLLVKMYGEDKPQFVTVSIGGDLSNTEDFEYDGKVFYYFRDDRELLESFRPSWQGAQTDFYTVTVLEDGQDEGEYHEYVAMATLITNLCGTVWARSLDEAEAMVDKHWIVDDFDKVGGEFTLDEVYPA